MSLPNAGNMGMMQGRKKKPGRLKAPGRYGAGPGTSGGSRAPYKPIGLPPAFSHGIS
jgi:hypothetical protein